MLTLLTVLILLVTPLLLLAAQAVLPRFRFAWLISALTSMSAWVLLLVIRNQIPQEIALVNWQPANLFPGALALLVDQTSWPFAFALVSVGVAVIWTDSARYAQNDWRAWSGSLALTGGGLLAIFAANATTLLVCWMLVDVIELGIILFYSRSNSRGAVLAFASQMAGIFVLAGAAIASTSLHSSVSFSLIDPRLSGYYLLACGLHLGILPIAIPIAPEQPVFRSMGTLMRMAPVASSLVLLVRTAQFGVTDNAYPLLLGLTVISALWSAVAWLRSKEAVTGRPYWVASVASLSLAAAIIGRPDASQAWGLSLLLAGSALFLYSLPHFRLRLLLLVTLFFAFGLPLTPSWPAAQLLSHLPARAAPFFWLVAGFIITGYFKHAWNLGSASAVAERWIWLVYPFGLGILPVSHLLASLENAQYLQMLRTPSWQNIWPGLLLLGISGGALLYERLMIDLPRPLQQLAGVKLNPEWLLRPFNWLANMLGSLLRLTSRILEGRGGILWTLVLLLLLLSILSQTTGGR